MELIERQALVNGRPFWPDRDVLSRTGRHRLGRPPGNRGLGGLGHLDERCRVGLTGPSGPFEPSPVTTTTTTTSTSSTSTSTSTESTSTSTSTTLPSTTSTSGGTTTSASAATPSVPAVPGATAPATSLTTASAGTTTTTNASAAPVPSVMDQVTAGTLGLFAAGSVGPWAALWYSTNGQYWSTLASADSVVDADPGAVITALLSTSTGIFAAGTWANGEHTSAALWYSPDGIHWRAVSPGAGSFGGPGDHAITSLVDMSATGGNTSGGGPDELLAVGGIRTGATWQPAAWISPDGFSWSPTSESFPLDHEPAGSPGALAYAAAMGGGGLYAVGGSPGRQRLWTSQQGLAWDEVALPAGAAGDAAWHLGLVATDGRTTVMADNLPGQPFLLVRQGTGWSQPSAQGAFGPPLASAVPTSLVQDNSSLVMSVDIARPGLRLGRGSNAVAILTSADGRSWRRVGGTSLHGDLVDQLMAMPEGLLAVGASIPPGEGTAGQGSRPPWPGRQGTAPSGPACSAACPLTLGLPGLDR